ncbi:MAG: hypothetical protein OQK35_02800 [Alphaproteobacteria bacterium]|nr:hypothetical protein [Alphaproteobacteria bacterium]
MSSPDPISLMLKLDARTGRAFTILLSIDEHQQWQQNIKKSTMTVAVKIIAVSVPNLSVRRKSEKAIRQNQQQAPRL